MYNPATVAELYVSKALSLFAMIDEYIIQLDVYNRISGFYTSRCLDVWKIPVWTSPSSCSTFKASSKPFATFLISGRDSRCLLDSLRRSASKYLRTILGGSAGSCISSTTGLRYGVLFW